MEIFNLDIDVSEHDMPDGKYGTVTVNSDQGLEAVVVSGPHGDTDQVVDVVVDVVSDVVEDYFSEGDSD